MAMISQARKGATMSGPLEGVRILDLSTVILGPWAAQTLGDMGADVIKVETPSGDTTRQLGPQRHANMASLFLGSNRNKRSIVLDLQQQEGRATLLRLAQTADVLLHNFRPRVVEKLGLDYEVFAAVNPELIYCATYGFRKAGPYRDKPAYDDVIQAACGTADLQRVVAGEPRYLPTIVADKTTSMAVVQAILAALFHRERHGGGQAIEVPMFETLVSFVMVEHLYGASFEPAIGKTGYERLLNPHRKPYQTKDGYLAVLPYTDDNWKVFFILAGRHDLLADERFQTLASRLAHIEELYGLLAEIVATRTSAEWQEALDQANVPVMVVNTPDTLLEDPQLAASEFWKFVDHPTEGRLRMSDPPITFSKTPCSIRRLQPRLGEHSLEVLKETGFRQDEIEALHAAGVTKIPQAP
jgi:crotonobetainyl-CoA:carnitine CoA-transferase CaiB-like acyl-CoA transferase